MGARPLKAPRKQLPLMPTVQGGCGSMSDSSPAETLVADADIEKALRDAVVNKYQSDPEQLTIKRIRTDVEQQLGLGDGFFKANPTWNTRSKEIIQLQVDAQEAQSQPPSSQPANSSPLNQKTPANKRSSGGSEGSGKRQKKNDPHRDNRGNGENTLAKGHRRRSVSSSLSSDTDEKKVEAIDGAVHRKKITNGAAAQESESEMSVVLDDDPKPKKGARKTSSEKPKSKKREGSKPAKASQQSSDPDTEEIKRLQGWLIKCGIRKMWFKELAPYDTPRAKIRHLKDMLTEAGMTGRFSQEKATQIREERELQADLDAVQAGNKQWGKAEPDEDTGGRPRRMLAKGLQELDFLRDDDSGDET
ncbi:MAG: hypothetical protein Q9209_005365 [Squamulea sp. 1 TL-2023]